jgi:hypothetical protein
MKVTDAFILLGQSSYCVKTNISYGLPASTLLHRNQCLRNNDHVTGEMINYTSAI